MEIKLNEEQIHAIERMIEDILTEERHGKDLLSQGLYMIDGCEMLHRAKLKYAGALGVLSKMGIITEINQYDEVTLKYKMK